MKHPLVGCLLLGELALGGCASIHNATPTGAAAAPPIEFSWPAPTEAQKAEIISLIDQLVFDDAEATNQPVLSPGITDQTAAYRVRFDRCQRAFGELTQFKSLAFPMLIQHLDDKRQSVNFRNHILENSVGYACYLIVYYQLQDRPENYSEYGWSRKGRDGKDHPKPYWVGDPFEDAGGLVRWLNGNRNLPYARMQIKCLEWLLAKEREIGACDAESYFVNILPLEIRILERRSEAGDAVADELSRLRRILEDQDESGIPPGVLPTKPPGRQTRDALYERFLLVLAERIELLPASAIKGRVSPARVWKEVDSHSEMAMRDFQLMLKQHGLDDRKDLVAAKQEVFELEKRQCRVFLDQLSQPHSTLRRFDEGPGRSAGYVILIDGKPRYWLEERFNRERDVHQ